jgi:hypothetical protein
LIEGKWLEAKLFEVQLLGLFFGSSEKVKLSDSPETEKA